MNTYLTRALLAASLTFFVTIPSSRAQQPMLEGSAGVDAKGVQHRWPGAGAKTANWQGDVLKLVPPSYPTRARRSKQQGSGVFRLSIEPASGKVTGVSVLKSTGVDVLDESAIFALRMWRMKPGTWRELDIPIDFRI